MLRHLDVLGAMIVAVALVALAVHDVAAQNNQVATTSEVQRAHAVPIVQGGKEVVTQAIGTTPAALFSSDLASANRIAKHVQLVRVTNRHSSNTVCLFDLAWTVAGATCADKCAAASTTCSGASTDGSPVLPSTQVGEAWDGTACLCGVASAASTTVTAERVARSVE